MQEKGQRERREERGGARVSEHQGKERRKGRGVGCVGWVGVATTTTKKERSFVVVEGVNKCVERNTTRRGWDVGVRGWEG